MMNPNNVVNPVMLQSPQQPQMQPQPPPPQAQPQQQPLMDSISKSKMLVGNLRDSLSSTLKAASQTLHHNNQADVGTM